MSNGPIKGNLIAEVQASFTFASTSNVTLAQGATLGDGQFYINGPLTVDTALNCVNSEFTMAASASIGGTGSIDWNNHEFNWEGGTIGGLTGGGFTIDGNCDFTTTGSATKTLATNMINIGSGTADFGGRGILQSDLASASSYGVVDVSGSATLAGTLQGQLENGYQPAPGTSFDVLNFGSSSGQFGTVNPEEWYANYNPTSVDLVEE